MATEIDEIITESKKMNDYIEMKKRTPLEIIHCPKCGHAQTIGHEPFNRLPRKYRHYRIDDNVAMALKRFCLPYGSINNGLSILLHKIKEIEGEQ